jgi:predicted Zn finger-like uncharacterized protein
MELRYVCPNCGATYEVSEDEVVVKCSYCNTVFRTHADEKRYLLPAFYDSSSAIEQFLLWVKKQLGYEETMPFHLEFKGVELHFYPFWVFSIYARTEFEGIGEDVEYLNPSRGGFRSIRRTSKPESGSYERFFEISIPASGDIPALDRDYRVSTRGRKYYSSTYVKEVGGLLHGARVDSETATAMSKEVATRRLSDLVFREVFKVTRRVDDVEIKDSLLIYVPVWKVNYSFKGKNYLALVDASSARTVYATYPADIAEKAGYVVTGLVHLAAAIASAATLAMLGALPAVVSFVGLSCSAVSYWLRSARPTEASEEES